MTRVGLSRRAIPIACLALASAGALPAAATSAGGGGGFTAIGRTVPVHDEARGTGKPPAAYGAQLVACRRSLRVEGRTAIVGATMRPIAGSTHFAVKIDLYQRPLGTSHWTLRADVPGLGSWTAPSDPEIGNRPSDVFRYRQAVGRLVVPYAYRFKIGFRWLDDSGVVLREATATTRGCRQPDLRPDLTVAGVKARATRTPGVVRYRVTVRNDGLSAARAVVGATLPGDTPPAQRIAQAGRVGPGETADVIIVGPGCVAEDTATAAFSVDPYGLVDEADEADNVLALPCPIP